jgi:nitrogenase-stabilizing/protective protein
MTDLMKQLGSLSAAEEFFDVLDVPYERAVINVNRLHILKRFHQYMRTKAGLETLDEAEQRRVCRELLTRAYQDFVRSTPAQEKVFKVFQDAEGGHVGLDSLRATLPSKRLGA